MPDPVNEKPQGPTPQGALLAVFSVPGMDCPNEAGLVRLKMGEEAAVASVEIDLTTRQVKVKHRGDTESVRASLAALGFGAELVEVSVTELEEHAPVRDAASERAVLWTVLGINAGMFAVELVAGWMARSTGLLADSLDMLADALVYAVGLNVVGRSLGAQRRAALLAGVLQIVLGLGVLSEVVRRALTGSDPVSLLMMTTASVALAANLVCAKLLSAHREGGAHMQASWIFTATDAVANLGVIVAGGLVLATGSGVPDLVVGTVIAGFVLYGALRIVRLSKSGPA